MKKQERKCREHGNTGTESKHTPEKRSYFPLQSSELYSPQGHNNGIHLGKLQGL